MAGTEVVWLGKERPASPLEGAIEWILMASREVAQRWSGSPGALGKTFTSTH